jgi:hypothetical protein
MSKAKFRYVYTNFWEDPKVSENFTPEDKFFFLYILTNPHTTQCGIYKITKKLIAFETGYSMESVNSLIFRFQQHHNIIKYNEETRELAIKNWGKFNLKNDGKPMIDCITPEIKAVEDKTLLLYVLDSIEKPKVNQVFINELVKFGLMKNEDTIEPNEEVPSDVDETLGDTSNDTFYAPLTTGGQKENKKEKENKKDNIYNNSQNKNNLVNNVDNVYNLNNLNINCDLNSSDETSDTRSSIPYEDIVKAYNAICISMPKVIKTTADRKKAIKARWNEYKDMNVFIELFTKAEKSDFLSGRDSKWSGCAFDWLLNSKNVLKVLEGNYDNKQNMQRQTGKVSTFNNFKQRPDALEKYKELERVTQEAIRQRHEHEVESSDGKAFIDRLRNRSKEMRD